MSNVASPDVDILKAVIDASCDAFDQAVVVCDRNDTLIFVSKQILKFFPLSPDDLLPGTPIRQLLGAIYELSDTHGFQNSRGTNRKTREDWIAQAIAMQWNEKFESVSRYGADRWLKAKGGRAANGIGITVLQDISEVMRLERKWRTDLDHIASTEAVLDEMPYPLFVKDKDLAFVGVNKAFCELYGVHPEEILGRTVWDIGDRALGTRLDASNHRVLETGKANRVIEEKAMVDGSVRKFVRNEFRVGKPENYFLVTVLNELGEGDEEDVSLLVGFGEDEDQSIDAYVPANPPGDQSSAVADCKKARILLVSADPVYSKLCIEALVQHGFDACTAVSLEEEEAFLNVSRQYSMMPDMVLVDERLQCECLDLASDFGVVSMIVEGGRPIHFTVAEVLANLPQNSDSQSQDEDETLFAHAGLPVFEGPDETPIYRYSDVEVLVVEDNPVNQQVFASILDGMDVQYRIASSGEDALVMFEELHPKLVFMDTTLPSMDCYETAHRIAAFGRERPTRAPIVGVLPKEDAGAEAKCLSSGMASCIVKPVSTEALQLVYDRYVEKPSYTAASCGMKN